MLSTLFRDICTPNNVNKSALPTKAKQTAPQIYAERLRTNTFKTVYESAPTNADRIAVTDTTCTFRLGYLGRPTKITAHISRLVNGKRITPPSDNNTTEQFDLLLPNLTTGALEWNQLYVFTLTNLQPNSHYQVTWSTEFAELNQSYQLNAVYGFSDISVPRIYTSPLVRQFFTHGAPISPTMSILGNLSFGYASANGRESVTYSLTLTSVGQPDIVKSDIVISPVTYSDIPPGEYEGTLRSNYSTGGVYVSGTFAVTIV